MYSSCVFWWFLWTFEAYQYDYQLPFVGWWPCNNFRNQALRLQNSLDKLHRYCSIWSLSVNTEKTKCMVMSLGNAKMPSFMFGDQILDNIQSYKYLGVNLHKNGKFSCAIILCMFWNIYGGIKCFLSLSLS